MPRNEQYEQLISKFGKRLRELRKERKLTQEKLAFDANLDRSYVASIEQGRRDVSFLRINDLCKAMKISLPEFFRGL